MPLKTTADVLAADATVTSLVAQRISPVIGAQTITAPYVIVTVLSSDPINHLSGYSNLTGSRVLVSCYAETYAQALAVAQACLNAMQAAGHHSEQRDTDQYDSNPDPGLYRVEHQFFVWT